MPRTKAIAAAPDQSQVVENFTASEETARDAEEAQALIDMEADKAAEERAWRDSELLSTDYTRLDDAPIDTGTKASAATYRQQLRDMPAQAGFPNTHTRPTRPAGA